MFRIEWRLSDKNEASYVISQSCSLSLCSYCLSCNLGISAVMCLVSSVRLQFRVLDLGVLSLGLSPILQYERSE